MKKLLFLSFLIFMACKNEGKKDAEINPGDSKELSVIEKIAQTNGIENFKQIHQLHYTFNVKVNDSLVTRRTWAWNPKTGEVRLTGNDSTITYNHKKEAETHKDIDQKFINDQYWLLFPFHLVWDTMEFEHDPSATAPMSGKAMQRLIVSYPQNAGYTPGDVYEIYFDEDYMIREWIYKPGGNEAKSLVASWEGYKELKGIKISTMHNNEKGTFQLFFTDLSVE